MQLGAGVTRCSFTARPSGSHGVAPCSIARPSFRWQDRQFIAAASSNGTAGDSGDGKRKEEQSNNVWENLKVGPLKYASSLHNVNKQYLRIRRRRKWWGRMQFPKVPVEQSVEDELPKAPLLLWQKVLPLGLIFFCASFNLTILQSLKDAIMVTAGGAETLPFLASFCVLPASVAFFVLYGKLVAHLPEGAVFYAAITPLLAFYALFATVLYPAAPGLHPTTLMESVMPSWPVGLHGLLKVAGNWVYSLFFCFAELWGAVVISVLFWSLANDVCTVDEAKSVYPLMGISANVALVVAGAFIKFANSTLAGGSQLLSLRVLVGTIMATTALMFLAKSFVDSRIIAPQRAAEAAAIAAGAGSEIAASGTKKPGKKKKAKGSIGESIEVLRNSPKILNLALLVMSYGVGHRLFEFAWKGQLRTLHSSVVGYQSVLADVATYTGMTTIVLMLTSRFVFQHLGWGVAAAATPVIMMITGAAFFATSVAAQQGLLPATMDPAVVAGLGVAAGVVTQVFARSSKYSLFDPAKEMVYIEMERDEKSRGKAAVDLVGSQIGKSGASWLTQAILLGMGSISAALPFIGVCFVGVCLMWIRATVQLQRQMESTEAERAERKAAGLATMTEDVMLSTDSPSPEPAPAAGAEEAAPVPVVPVVPVASNGNGHNGNGNGNGHSANGNGKYASANGNGNGNGAKPAAAQADASAEVVLADTGSKLKQS